MKTYNIYVLREKWSVIKRVESSKNKERELARMGIPKSTYYDWKRNNCQTKSKAPHKVWNKTPKEIENKIVVYRTSADALKQSSARILENLEQADNYTISLITRLALNSTSG